jgi:hypothetical protein
MSLHDVKQYHDHPDFEVHTYMMIVKILNILLSLELFAVLRLMTNQVNMQWHHKLNIFADICVLNIAILIQLPLSSFVIVRV